MVGLSQGSTSWHGRDFDDRIEFQKFDSIKGNNERVCLMAAGTEPQGTRHLLPINAVIHAGLALVVSAVGGVNCSIGSIDGGIIFGIHMFILGPLLMLKTSKFSGDPFSRGGDRARGVVLGIIAAGVVSAPIYVAMCDLSFE